MEDGRHLVALENVDLGGGDGKVETLSSYGEAEQRVKDGFMEGTNAAAFWHPSTHRLILKPKNAGAKWTHGEGTLFMWADDLLSNPSEGLVKPVTDAGSGGSGGDGGQTASVVPVATPASPADAPDAGPPIL